MSNPDRIGISPDEAREVLRVLAGFQGLLLADVITADMLSGSSFRELGVNRQDREGATKLANIIEGLLETLRREGV